MTTLFPDLFETVQAESALPGFASRSDFVSAQEERDLIERIDAETLTPFRFQGWLGKRLTASFGWSYDFDAGKVVDAEPIPDWLMPVRARAAELAGLAPPALLQALLIRYDPGATIGWHRDRPVFDTVVGISLGAEATMRFRRQQAARRYGRRHAALEPRSAYVLQGEARREWQHSITALAETRWSITFRSQAACV